ncbi:hypothetical protein GF385_04060 [Candidatus Dependentiae bacterium]|nr:hypothetical protein [Candidatus Dependentiae bacterium]
MNTAHKAFSLFEILITIAAIFIFVTLTIPKFSFIDKFILQNEVDKLFTTFSYLQQKAIAQNNVQELIFDLNKNGYYFLEKGNKKFCILPNKVLFGVLNNVLGPPSSPKKKIKFPISFEKLNVYKFRVIFFPDGKISSGSVFLINKNKNHLMALSCPVSPFSCIRKYKYENNRWVSLK